MSGTDLSPSSALAAPIGAALAVPGVPDADAGSDRPAPATAAVAGTRRERWQAGWRLVTPYWTSERRWRAFGLLAVVLALEGIRIWLGVRLSYWQKNFYDALVNRDIDEFWRQLRELLFVALSGVAATTARTWFNQLLEIDWRGWLTEVYLQRWLGDRRYHRLEQGKRVDNPDQRIADDLRQMASDTLELSIGLLRNVVDLFVFSALIWSMSGAISFAIGGQTLSIPGYMLWAAVLYALVGTLVMEKVGHRMVGIDYQQQKCEADFRYLLVRVRENAEQIAFYDGGATEATRLRHSFAALRANWRRVMDYTKRVTLVHSIYMEVGGVLPYLITGPRYFAKELTVGALMQLGTGFARVRACLSWFIYRYKAIAMLRSVYRRLIEFDRVLREDASGGIVAGESADASLRVHGLQLRLPDGDALARIDDWALRPGERWLIRGPSGAGKSTLLRALAGLWPHGEGRIAWPAGTTLFVPQQNYLPVGPLRAGLAYPRDEHWFGTGECIEALQAVGLHKLADRLDEVDHWARSLSPGEQQRLAFARVLLYKPALLFLDESTSSLDADNEARMYRAVIDRLPHITLVSVAHRDSVARHHTHLLAWNSHASWTTGPLETSR